VSDLDEDIKPRDASASTVMISRRQFTKLLGAGILITVGGTDAGAGQKAKAASPISDRLHVGVNGVITVMTGKVDIGQGSRTELTQVAAEELKVDIASIRLIMGDTALCPDDGSTGSSLTTPRTVPRVRAACAAARQVLIKMAARNWGCDVGLLKAAAGTVVHSTNGQSISYGELARVGGVDEAMEQAGENTDAVTPVEEWTVMGHPLRRLTSEDIVTGAQVFPSDVRRPGMHYGKILNPPAYGAKLKTVDLEAAEKVEGVTATRDGNFVGVTAPTSHLAELAVERIADTARWETFAQPSSSGLFKYIREHVSERHAKQGKVVQKSGSLQAGLDSAAQVLSESYTVAHIQHAPMEPRAAVAEWSNGNITVWAGTADPFPVRRTLSKELAIPAERIRVIVPDTGGHFCGKHTGEAAIQAAKLARAAGRPVHIRWTREEEFTWAYFRKAGIIDVRAGLDTSGRVTTWDWTTWHSGNSAIPVPYDIPNIFVQSKASGTPVREGSYRAVAAPANLFARESFMDELAHAAKVDPLEFRLRHISNERLRTVVDAAARSFGWNRANKIVADRRGIGVACGTEKGSFVATCAEVEVDRKKGEIRVVKVCEAFECGAIINPANLKIQVEGCIVMGMGGALWEEIRFDNGRILNAGFDRYRVPRFSDVPELDVILMDRPDLPSTGAGETPMITIAPAIANAVFAATGVRIRSMPIKGEYLKKG
jgi:isoquinoline 1-oxidoreductase